MQLDKWQQEIMDYKGNLCLCSGRQVGKSTVIARKSVEFMVKNPNSSVIIGAAIERQAIHIFWMVKHYVMEKYKDKIKGKPTMTFLELDNGSRMQCLPIGDDGLGVRGFTADLLIIDEAAFVNEKAWGGITPLLATTQGALVLLSTPFGTENYFSQCYNEDKSFKTWHVSSEDCPRITKEFLARERQRMTKFQYQQEYLGLFVGGIQRFVPDDLIDKVCIIKEHTPRWDKFQGIDIARMGGDETVMVSFDRINREELVQFDMLIPEAQTLTDTARLIIHKDKTIKHKKIYMDDGGLGVGVYDILFEDQQTKRKVVGLNNASRQIDIIPKPKKLGVHPTPIRKKTLLGVDMAVNLKILMEKGKIKLFDDPRIRQSLRSMQYDNSEGTLRIYGSYDHIFEALKRAAHCMKDKSLNIYYF